MQPPASPGCWLGQQHLLFTAKGTAGCGIARTPSLTLSSSRPHLPRCLNPNFLFTLSHLEHSLRPSSEFAGSQLLLVAPGSKVLRLCPTVEQRQHGGKGLRDHMRGESLVPALPTQDLFLNRPPAEEPGAPLVNKPGLGFPKVPYAIRKKRAPEGLLE